MEVVAYKVNLNPPSSFNFQLTTRAWARLPEQIAATDANKIKALWSKFQDEVIEGLPPAVCSSTAAIAASLPSPPSASHPPPPSPSYRVCQSLPPIQDDASMLHNVRDQRMTEQQEARPADLSPERDGQEPWPRNTTARAMASPASPPEAGEEKQQPDIRTKTSASRPHRPLGLPPKKTTSVVHPIAPAEGFGCLVASSSVGNGIGPTESRQTGNGANQL